MAARNNLRRLSDLRLVHRRARPRCRPSASVFAASSVDPATRRRAARGGGGQSALVGASTVAARSRILAATVACRRRARRRRSTTRPRLIVQVILALGAGERGLRRRHPHGCTVDGRDRAWCSSCRRSPPPCRARRNVAPRAGRVGTRPAAEFDLVELQSRGPAIRCDDARRPHHPLPRRRRRPRGQGRELRRPARRRRSGRAGRPLRRARAPTSWCSSTSRRRATTATPSSTSSRRTAEEVFIPFTIGGGIRTVDDARRLLRAGRRQGVGQHRRRRSGPSWCREIATEFGSSVRGGGHRRPALATTTSPPSGFEVYTHGGRTPTGLDAVEWARRAEALGAGEILLTSMDRDGTKDGFDLPLTRAIADAVDDPGDRERRRGRARAPGRRGRRGPRRRGAGRVDLPLRRAHRGRGQGAT